MESHGMNSHSGLLLRSGILELWHDKELKDFEGDTKAHELVLKWLEEYPNNSKGLLLYGDNGVGKTYLMATLLKSLLLERHVPVLLRSFPTLVGQYTKNWRGEGEFPKYMNKNVFGLEELGKEFGGSDKSKELATSALDYFLRYRVQRKLPTIATTNLYPADIVEVYGKSMSSLFKEAFVLVHVDGKDFRSTL